MGLLDDLEEESYLDGGYDDDSDDLMDLDDLETDTFTHHPENLLENSDEENDTDEGGILDSWDDSGSEDLDSPVDLPSKSLDVEPIKDIPEINNSEDFLSGEENSYMGEGFDTFEELGENLDFDEEESLLLNEAESEGYFGKTSEILEDYAGSYGSSGYESSWGLDTGLDSMGGLGVGSSGRDVYTRASLVNFYDDAASGEDVSIGSFDSSSAMFGRFADQIGQERAELVSEVIGAWVNWPTNKSTAPLWHIFAEANDNFKVPIEFEEDGIDAEAFGEALHSFSEFTEQEFRDRYGDSVVLYRSIDEQGLRKMEEDAPETGSRVLDHRPVESWTLDPEFAESWKSGYVLRKEIDVEDILASQVTHPSFIGREKEVLVESDGREKYSEDEVVHSSEFDMEENAEWALSKLGHSNEEVEGRVKGPEWMARENKIDRVPLDQYGAITVNKSSEFMHVGVYEDGREAFVTELSSSEYQGPDGADPVEAERALAGEQFFENIGLDKYIPEHFVDLEEGYMAVEAVDGYEIDNAPEEVREEVDADEYLKFAAATILSGNSDMDGRNTMIDQDGHIYGIDIDHAGGDFTEGGRHYRRGMQDLKRNADKIGLDIDYSDIKEATQIVADQIDPFEATKGIKSSQVSNKDLYDFRGNIVNNINSFAQGVFPGEFGYAENTGAEYGKEVARI